MTRAADADRSARTRSSRLLGWWGVAFLIQAVVAVAGVHHVRLAGYTAVSPFTDLAVFQGYAAAILDGRWPIRDFTLEYPPLAIPLFVAPEVVAVGLGGGPVPGLHPGVRRGDAPHRRRGDLARRPCGRASRGDRPRAGPTGLVHQLLHHPLPLIVVRFDLAAMLAAFAAAVWLDRGRMAAGGVLAGAGATIKVVPGLVLLPLVAGRASIRSKVAAVRACAWVIGAGVLGSVALGGEKALALIQFHADRGVEINSTYASASMLIHELVGTSLAITWDHNCVNIDGPGVWFMGRASVVIQVAGLLVVAWRARRAREADSLRLAGASILAFVIGGKVLSPQYLIWLIPFVAVTGVGRKLFLVCCLLTTATYPWFFAQLCQLQRPAEALLIARNLGLIWLWGADAPHPDPGPRQPTDRR